MPLKLGNRVTEKDIRQWLDDNELQGNSAQINDLELHAIKRPGWVQLYRFSLKVRSSTEGSESDSKPIWLERTGVVLDDERIRNPGLKTQVWIFESGQQQIEKLEELSSDMLTCRTGQNGQVLTMVGLFFLLIMIAMMSLSLF
jgi:hypothetical protein